MNEQLWPYTTPGIPDGLFRRGSVPMTKEEVRAVALAKARLRPDSVVYDVGAGTGSLSVEAALQASQGHVYAVERDPEAVELVRDNAERFGVRNIEVVVGMAPDALADLPLADRVLVGGSGGHLAEILQVSREKLAPGGRLVLLSVSLETQAKAWGLLQELGFTCEATLVQAARSRQLGGQHLWQGLNPVVILSGEVG